VRRRAVNRPIADARERIVATAQALFARFGLRKTTLDEIIRRANVAKGTFYRYFSNKEALFREVIERESEMMMSLIGKAVADAATPVDKIAAYLKARVESVSELSNLYEITRERVSEHWPRCEEIRERHLLEEQRIVRGILEDGVSQGVFELRTPELAAAAIVMAARGLESSWMLEANSLEAEQGADILLGVLFQGIMRR
jgi:AcrR family transcriptional regulator